MILRLLPRRPHHARLALYSSPGQPCFSTSSSHQDGTSSESQQSDKHELRQTHHVRSGGNRPLPLPPSMDAVKANARQRHRLPKQPPDSKNLTPFQTKLYANPYAHALATPPRKCNQTSTRLPSYFLLHLTLLPHPETHAPHLLPTSLYASSSPTSPTLHRTLAGTWFHLRHPLLAHLSIPTTRGKPRALPALSSRIKATLGRAMAAIVWRPDMPDLVLDLLRQTAARKLRWLLAHPNAGLVVPWASGVVDGLDEIEDVGAVVCFRGFVSPAVEDVRTRVDALMETCDRLAQKVGSVPKARASALADAVERSPMSGYAAREYILAPRLAPEAAETPLVFESVVWRGRRVEVFSAVDLLGEEGARALRAGTVFEGEEHVVVRESRVTVAARMSLGRLKGYLAEGV